MSTANLETNPTSHDAPHNGTTLPSQSFEGNLVSMTGNHLVITNTVGERFPLTLAKDAKLTCDGAACESEVLKIGRRIRVTTRLGNRNVVTGIDTLDKHAEFSL
jgi:hypothetical protein